MPLQRYEVRVAGAAEMADEYEPRLRAVADELGAHSFSVAQSEGDLLAIVAFEVSDAAAGVAEGDELVGKIKQVLPLELHDRIQLTISDWP